MSASVTLKERAIDFAIKKFCAEEKRKNEEYNAWLKVKGYKGSFDYDADRGFQWIKEQQKAYDTAKESLVILYKNRAFVVIAEAERLATLLLEPTATSYHSSGRAAAQQRKQLKWFEESPEFKDLVLSAIMRVHD